MSRSVFTFIAHDVSAFARLLNRELEACDGKPGHVQLLNMLTRSAGYRNYQHFRAQFEAEDRLRLPTPVPELIDHLRVERVIRHFDEAGALIRWPSKTNQQELCLWALWSRIPAAQSFKEMQINEILQAHHQFGDHALLRRELVNYKLIWRTPDCRTYRRIERRPPPDALAIIRHLNARWTDPAVRPSNVR
ncbi:DUF2087 domain-containing protein [Beijerinckia indica]|uniref:DUF2087 domain-containing protein n=1 Tax=Beijerinckia indica subsp. indica (strain ATCC 9039 / DSM 1715 / NCIMB 8712) TaxID=395963 RepID=B2IKX6_BEII9|nr:DUF2087 domain-containing protein [Beijerinckia indica]ACB96516.1 conserved hypothetical protein [Beijerinckia indica subsp. indica ATCC 9039]